MKLAEWDDRPYSFGSKEKLADFANYLAGVWQSRIRYLPESECLSEEEQQEQHIQRQRFFDITFEGKLYARNYVGVVQYEDTRIEVYPKIFKHSSVESDKWQLNLLYWLSYCSRIRFPFSISDIAESPFDDFLELMIYIFANRTEEVLTQQPFQSYQSVEEETFFLKGRLLFNDYIKNNLVTGQWQKFYCGYEPFIYDNLFNRIIKYVTKRLKTISRNERNKQKLDNLLFLLDEVSDVPCTAKDCETVRLNAYYEDHAQILFLCKLYLSHQVIDMSSGESKNFCFLVPMEYVFEDFIAGFIEDKWSHILNIASQSITNLTAGREFWIRNDIYIKNKLIVDTKYKLLNHTDDKTVGIVHADIYQMISYALGRNCKRVLLLYPTADTLDKSKIFDVPSAMLNENVNIAVKEINISFNEITEADDILIKRVRELDDIFK